MQQLFQKHILEELSFLTQARLLLAVSGGVDSMVMVDLFQKHKAHFGVAHCNFQLRGNESDNDAEFVKDFAKNNGLPFYTTRFETTKFAADYKLSIQVAARELRYKWFLELLEYHQFDYVLTAHHADDKLETFLINLSRGTGIDGLTGIPQLQDRVVRPLLHFSRESIEKYALENQIAWREDSSNLSDKYLRNKIRHEIVPALKALNPEFLSAFQKTQNFLQQTQSMAEDAAVLVFQQVAQHANDEIHFNIDQLQRLPNYHSYLFRWLREYGFTAWNDIYELCDSQSGKQVFSPDFRLLKSRHFLILSPINHTLSSDSYRIEQEQIEVNFPLRLSICKVQDISDVSINTIFVDAEKIQFPLQIRKWREGDVFKPFGMNGQSKKVSKFFKDQGLSLIDKEKTWLLCSADQIVWIVGRRADERFKVNKTTNQILKITHNP